MPIFSCNIQGQMKKPFSLLHNTHWVSMIVVDLTPNSTFEEVKPQLQKVAEQSRANDYRQPLKAKAKIEIK